MEHAPQILEQEEMGQKIEELAALPPASRQVAELGASDRPPGGSGSTDPSLAQGGPMPHRYELHDEPTGSMLSGQQQQHRQSFATPQIRLPGVDGRESLDDGSWAPGHHVQTSGLDDEEEWTRDALMHMNLAGQMPKQG
jgi:hypothetical protein